MSAKQLKIVKYDFRKEGPERRPIVLGLLKIHVLLNENYLDSHLDKEMLDELGIDVSPLPLDTGSSDANEAGFFEPLARHVIDEKWAEIEEGEIQWPERGCFTVDNFSAGSHVMDFANEIAYFPLMEYSNHWQSRYRTDKGFEACLYHVRTSINEQWLVSRVFEDLNHQYPHIRSELLEMTEINNDDGLLRSEAMSITALMLQRFFRRKTLPHRLVPVILFTYSGFNVRMLQAYFEGDRMHVFKSDIINFDKEHNVEGIKRLVCWIVCKARGNTRWPDVPKDPYSS